MNLVECAIKAMDNSYSPYSNFKVGAALLTKDGKIFTGCNIESVSYTPSNCAERTAFFKAISEGYKEFDSIAITGGLNGIINKYCYPCGVCRQVMSEFCSDDFKIIVYDGTNTKTYLLSELLPNSFGDIK